MSGFAAMVLALWGIFHAANPQKAQHGASGWIRGNEWLLTLWQKRHEWLAI